MSVLKAGLYTPLYTANRHYEIEFAGFTWLPGMGRRVPFPVSFTETPRTLCVNSRAKRGDFMKRVHNVARYSIQLAEYAKAVGV